MNEDKISELIDYLAGLGFEDIHFEEELRSNIVSGRSFFSIPYSKNYGNEQMLFVLKFRKDHQFDAYRLEGYKATHRKPIEIERKIINGIDTRELEERMQKIDWNAHFNKAVKYPENPKDEKTAKVISDLYVLDGHQNLEGIRLQELLQLKYFPEGVLDEWLKDLRSLYDRNREFTATGNRLCNANLAYHILSGRLDELHEKLQSMELENLSTEDTYIALERILSKNPDAFELKCLYSTTEGDAEIVVPFSKIDGRYSADDYTITFTPYPAIEHGTFSGVDTRELEGLMQEIDWKNDSELYTLHRDKEPELMPKVEEIVTRINELCKDADGVRKGDQLKLKYWTDASFFDGLIEERTWKYLESLPKRVQQFPIKTKAKAAFNLLCGRAVLDTPLYNTLPEIIDWKRLDLSQKDTEDNYPIQNAGSFSKSELEKVLHCLPIDGMDFYPVRNGLMQGDLLPVQLNDGRNVMFLANPGQKTIDIFTPDMRPIPVNLRLDPEWKPATKQKENTPEMKQNKPSEPKQSVFSKQLKSRHKRGKRM